MGKHFDDDFKEKIVKEYKTREYGGHAQLAKNMESTRIQFGIG